MKKEEIVWQNQQNIRVANQIKVINLFRHGVQSCSSIAKTLGLSNTAIEKVVDELYDAKILTKAEYTAKKTKGRTPNLFKINVNLGVIAAVDLSGRDIVYCLSDLANRILIKDKIENVNYVTIDIVNMIINGIKKMLENEKIEKRPLLNICISSPGKIDRKTKKYIYAPRIDDYKNLNIYEIFKNSFNVEVYIYNDVNLGLLGEKALGNILDDYRNVYFAHIDITAGSALMLNNKIYIGTNGFAGEIADYKEIDDISTNNYSGRLYTITEIYIDIINKVKNIPLHPLHNMEILKLQDVCDLFLSNDKIVTDAIEKSAKINAIQFLSVANLLDLDVIIIEGNILNFGDKYKEMLEKYYKMYDKNHITTSLKFSTLNTSSILLGAMYQGISMFYLNEFEKMVANRTNNQSYNIENYFDTLI